MGLFSRFFGGTAAKTQPTEIRSASVGGGDVLVIGGEGGGGSSQPKVNAMNAEQLSAVNVCIRVITQDVGRGSLMAYRRMPDDGRVKANDHPNFRLINDRPSPWMNGLVFRKTLTRHLALTGNGYGYLKKSGIRIESALPLHPSAVRPMIVDGALLYEVTINRKKEYVSPEFILHLIGESDDGIVGLSPVEQMARSLGISLNSEVYAQKFYANGSHLKGILRHPGKLSDDAEQHLTDTWKTDYTGSMNSWKTPLLEEGMTYESIDVSPQEAQFIEVRKFQFNDIIRIWRVSPPKAGDLERSTFSNVEELYIDHVGSCLMPYFQAWERELNNKLWTEAGREQYYFEFNADALLRGDRASQDESFAKGIQNGWYCINDVRRKLNEPPIPGGDTYLQPLNMTPAAERAPEQPAEEPIVEKQDAEEIQEPEQRSIDPTPIIRAAQKRILTKESNAIRRAAKQFLPAQPDEFRTWVDEFYFAHEVHVRESLEPVAETFGFDINTQVTEHVTRSQSELAYAIGDSDPAGSVERTLTDWMTNRITGDA